MTDYISLKTPFNKSNGRDDRLRSNEALLDLVRFLARRAAEADYEALLEEERRHGTEPGGHPASKKGEPKP